MEICYTKEKQRNLSQKGFYSHDESNQVHDIHTHIWMGNVLYIIYSFFSTKRTYITKTSKSSIIFTLLDIWFSTWLNIITVNMSSYIHTHIHHHNHDWLLFYHIFMMLFCTWMTTMTPFIYHFLGNTTYTHASDKCL